MVGDVSLLGLIIPYGIRWEDRWGQQSTPYVVVSKTTIWELTAQLV